MQQHVESTHFHVMRRHQRAFSPALATIFLPGLGYYAGHDAHHHWNLEATLPAHAYRTTIPSTGEGKKEEYRSPEQGPGRGLQTMHQGARHLGSGQGTHVHLFRLFVFSVDNMHNL